MAVVDGKKRCSKCGEWKEVGEFNKKKSRSDGYNYLCKPCQKVENAEAYKRNFEKNKEKYRERSARWYRENKEKTYESHKRWKENNPEKVKTYNDKRCEKIKEKNRPFVEARRSAEIKRIQEREEKRKAELEEKQRKEKEFRETCLTRKEKPCTWCGVVKPLYEFSPDPLHWSGRQSHCKICEAKRVEGYKKRNPEKVETNRAIAWFVYRGVCPENLTQELIGARMKHKVLTQRLKATRR